MPALSCPCTVRGPARVCLCQIRTQPPTFAIFANRKDIPESYLRFLVNALREEFGFQGCPIRVVVRPPKNPFRDARK